MNTLRRLRGRLALAGIALFLILPAAGCTSNEPPKVIDTSTPAKLPEAPTMHPVQPTSPGK